MEITISNQVPLLNSTLRWEWNSTGLDPNTMVELQQDFRQTFYTHQEGKTVALICLYVPIFIIAFFGNILVLMVVIPNRHMRSVTNCFIVNLAIADLLGKYVLLLLFINKYTPLCFPPNGYTIISIN